VLGSISGSPAEPCGGTSTAFPPFLVVEAQKFDLIEILVVEGLKLMY
jgi:hypothetical protein